MIIQTFGYFLSRKVKFSRIWQGAPLWCRPHFIWFNEKKSKLNKINLSYGFWRNIFNCQIFIQSLYVTHLFDTKENYLQLLPTFWVDLAFFDSPAFKKLSTLGTHQCTRNFGKIISRLTSMDILTIDISFF